MRERRDGKKAIRDVPRQSQKLKKKKKESTQQSDSSSDFFTCGGSGSQRSIQVEGGLLGTGGSQLALVLQLGAADGVLPQVHPGCCPHPRGLCTCKKTNRVDRRVHCLFCKGSAAFVSGINREIRHVKYVFY